MLSCLSLFEGLMTHIDQSDYRSHDPYFHFVLMYDIIENKKRADTWNEIL
jgi:hypothetical protein